MNPLAAKFFADNPQAKYWYASPSIRFPNPRLIHRPDWEPDPWPDRWDATVGAR